MPGFRDIARRRPVRRGSFRVVQHQSLVPPPLSPVEVLTVFESWRRHLQQRPVAGKAIVCGGNVLGASLNQHRVDTVAHRD